MYIHPCKMRLLCACSCKDVHENLFGSSLLLNKLQFQISQRFELSLQRYLQNGTAFQNSLIFIVFSIFSLLRASKVFKDGKLLNGYGIFWKLDFKLYISNGQKDTCPSLWVAFYPKQSSHTFAQFPNNTLQFILIQTYLTQKRKRAYVYYYARYCGKYSTNT